MNAAAWIKHLDLRLHPEGGYYKEIYRAEPISDDSKASVTSIYYLLEDNQKSAFHRLKSSEVWYYHTGYP